MNSTMQDLLEGDFQQRWEAAKVLPKLGAEAIPPLIELVADGEVEAELRWFAARILGEFAGKEEIAALMHLLEGAEEEELRLMAATALGQIGTEAIAPLTELLSGDSRELAVKALAQIRQAETIEPLLAMAGDPLPAVRATAIEALGSFHDRRLLPVFLASLEDRAAPVRKEAAIALGMWADLASEQDLVGAIAPLLSDLDGEVCQQAAIALGRLGGERAAEVVFHLLKSPATPSWLKQEAVRALNWMESPLALTYLAEGLHWSDLPVCQEIVAALGRQQKPGLQEQAAQILSHFCGSRQEAASQPQIKQAIALSLGKLGQPAALQPLLRLAADPNRGVQLHAIAALKKMSPASEPRDPERR